MMTGPVRASSEWLRLREAADAAARASELVEKVRSYLPTHGAAAIHDLGCGTGSMARSLAVRLPGPQHWVMYDRDDELLTLAAADPPDRASDGTPVTMETRRRDITRMELVELAGAALITASALLDMMTAEELERLVATCAGADCPVLIALSVTGRVEITPAEPFDQSVTDAFNAHQRRTTSAGKLLGPDAVGAAVDGFTRLGLEVLLRPSPWRLGPGHAALAAAWFTGWLPGHASSDPSCGPMLRRTQDDASRRQPPATCLSPCTTRICWCGRDDSSEVDGQSVPYASASSRSSHGGPACVRLCRPSWLHRGRHPLRDDDSDLRDAPDRLEQLRPAVAPLAPKDVAGEALAVDPDQQQDLGIRRHRRQPGRGRDAPGRRRAR